MRLFIDILLVLLVFLFAYAFGRKDNEGQPIIPINVTWFSLFIILGLMFLLNFPAIMELVGSYGRR